MRAWKISFGTLGLLCGLQLHTILAKAATPTVSEIGAWEEQGARALFHRKGGHWVSRKTRVYRAEALRNLPLQFASPKKWQANYQGKSAGELKTEPYNSYERISQQGLQRISSAPSVSFRQRSENFATLGQSSGLRPVLLTNEKLSPSPSWENHLVSAASVEKAKKAFIQRLDGKMSFFKDPNFKFRDKNRHTLPADLQTKASFHSKEGDLVGFVVHSNNSFPNCRVKKLDCRLFDPQWFLVHAGSVSYFGDAAAFIDAADLEGKGKQTFFFLINRPADSGYVLINQNGKRTEFTWGSQ